MRNADAWSTRQPPTTSNYATRHEIERKACYVALNLRPNTLDTGRFAPWCFHLRDKPWFRQFLPLAFPSITKKCGPGNSIGVKATSKRVVPAISSASIQHPRHRQTINVDTMGGQAGEQGEHSRVWPSIDMPPRQRAAAALFASRFPASTVSSARYSAIPPSLRNTRCALTSQSSPRGKPPAAPSAESSGESSMSQIRAWS